jgi:hypothetical protein
VVEEPGDDLWVDLLFLPYWDATHDQDLPGWVKHLRPRGGDRESCPRTCQDTPGTARPVGWILWTDATVQGKRIELL